MNKAVGLLEVQGFSVALAAMDQALKAADVRIEGIDCNNPSTGDLAPIPVVIQVKFSGSISDVKVALEVAQKAAEKYIAAEDILTHFIPSALEGLEPLLAVGKVYRKV